MIDLEHAKLLCENSSPGPWRKCVSATGVVDANSNWVCQVSKITPQTDVEFIAASRQLVPELIEQLRSVKSAFAAYTRCPNCGNNPDGIIQKQREQLDTLLRRALAAENRVQQLEALLRRALAAENRVQQLEAESAKR